MGFGLCCLSCSTCSDDNPPEKPDPKREWGALRSGLSIALFLFLVALVSYLSLHFVLALVDKLS